MGLCRSIIYSPYISSNKQLEIQMKEEVPLNTRENILHVYYLKITFLKRHDSYTKEINPYIVSLNILKYNLCQEEGIIFFYLSWSKNAT